MKAKRSAMASFKMSSKKRGLEGVFITFEGAEGSGKSTQAELLYAFLKKHRHSCLFLREPGGVAISECIRKLLLDVRHQEMTRECETLLYLAARSQLVEEVLYPALAAGKVVVCDRFLDSTVVYQGFGNGVSRRMIQAIGRWVTRSIQPDITFLLDIDVKKGLARRGESRDRIERRSLAYHNRVRQGYLTLARENPRRIKVIPGSGSKEKIQEEILLYVSRLLRRRV